MILVISGSSRTFSNNRGLANYVVNNLNQKGQEVEFFDLSKNPLPIFTGNVTEYENANVSKLKEIANRANSFVICTPEYHNGMSGGLKNALDFLSKEQFLNKPVTILWAAGSGKGGVNALNNLRLVIRGLHGLVLPQQHICDSIFFDDCQNLIDEVSKEIINNMMIDLVNFV